MEKQYYLHFRKPPMPETLSVLAENDVALEPVFETSFDVKTDLSFSGLLHLLKSRCSGEEYRLLTIYKASTCSPRSD